MRGGRVLGLLSLFLCLGLSTGQDLLYPRDNAAPADNGGGNGNGNGNGGNNAATQVNQPAATATQAAQSTLATITTTPVQATSSSNPSTTTSAASSTATSTPVSLPIQPTLTPATGLAGAILILSGLVYGFWSIKNRLVHNFLSVSYAGALAVTCLIVFVESPGGSDGQQAGYVVAAILTGAVLGGLSSPFAVLTEGAGCFLGGFCIAMWFMCLKDNGLITSRAGSTTFILATTAAVGVLGFVRFTRARALTVCIPFSAATAIVLGIDCFARAGLKEFWIYIWGINANLFPLNTNTYPVTRPIRVETSCTIVVFLVALVVNVKFFTFLEQRKAERREQKRLKQEELDRIESEAGLRTEKQVSRDKLLWEKRYGGKGSQSESALVSTDSLRKESIRDNDNRHSGTNTIEMSDVDEMIDRRVSGTGTPITIDVNDEKNSVATGKPKKTKRIIINERPPSPSIIPLPFGINKTIDPTQVPQPAPSRKSSKSVEKEKEKEKETERETEKEADKETEKEVDKETEKAKSMKKFGLGADLEEDRQPMSENGEQVPEEDDDASERGYESSVFGLDDFSQRGFASRPNSMHSMLSMLVFNDDDPTQESRNENRNSMLSMHSKKMHSRVPSFVETRQEALASVPNKVEDASVENASTANAKKESEIQDGGPREAEAITAEKESEIRDGEPKDAASITAKKDQDPLESSNVEATKGQESIDSAQRAPETDEAKNQTKDQDITEKEESIPAQDSTTAITKSEIAEMESRDDDIMSRDGTAPVLSSKASTKRRQAAKLSRQSLQQLGGDTSSRLMKVYKQHKIFEWAKESTRADQPPEEELSAPPSPGIRYATVEPDNGRKPEEIEVEIEDEVEDTMKQEQAVKYAQPAESVAFQNVRAESVTSASETNEQIQAPLRIIPSPSPTLSRQNSVGSIRQRPSRNFSSPIFGQSALHDLIEEEPENEITQMPEKNNTLLGQREHTLKNRLSNVNFNAIPVSAFSQSPVNIAAPLVDGAQPLEENDDLPLSVRKKLLLNRRNSSLSESQFQTITPQRSFSYGNQAEVSGLQNRDSMISNTPYQSLSGLGSHRLSQANAVGNVGTNTFDSHQPSHGEDRQTPEERAARLASWRVSLQQDPRYAQQTTLALGDMHREQMMRDKRMQSMLNRQQSMEKERLSQVIDQTMRAPDAVMLHMKRLSAIQAQAKIE